MGCDQLKLNKGQAATGVSIHAPTWGATLNDLPSALVLVVSIHAPTWGATKDYTEGAW